MLLADRCDIRGQNTCIESVSVIKQQGMGKHCGLKAGTLVFFRFKTFSRSDASRSRFW